MYVLGVTSPQMNGVPLRSQGLCSESSSISNEHSGTMEEDGERQDLIYMFYLLPKVLFSIPLFSLQNNTVQNLKKEERRV